MRWPFASWQSTSAALPEWKRVASEKITMQTITKKVGCSLAGFVYDRPALANECKGSVTFVPFRSAQ